MTTIQHSSLVLIVRLPFTIFNIGPLFACASLMILAFSSVFLYIILLQKSVILTIIGTIIMLIDLGSFALTATLNPGIPDRNLQKYTQEYVETLSKSKSFGYCEKCKIIKNTALLTHHCNECDICVEGYDHHCPWTGKCIGKGNAPFFYTFLSSTFILLFYLMGASLSTLP